MCHSNKLHKIIYLKCKICKEKKRKESALKVIKLNTRLNRFFFFFSFPSRYACAYTAWYTVNQRKTKKILRICFASIETIISDLRYLFLLLQLWKFTQPEGIKKESKANKSGQNTATKQRQLTKAWTRGIVFACVFDNPKL